MYLSLIPVIFSNPADDVEGKRLTHFTQAKKWKISVWVKTFYCFIFSTVKCNKQVVGCVFAL